MVAATENETRADELVRGAHARAYRYPEAFEGFEARFEWRTERGAGSGTVSALKGPEIEVSGDQDAAPDWIARELRSIVGHRQFVEYEAGDGAHAKTLGRAHVLGEVVELGDSMNSAYRVSDGEIATVTRTLDDRRFTIVVHDRQRFDDGRTLPTSFTVFYWDASTAALTATEAYRDDVVEVEGVFLPAARRVVRGDEEGLSVRELELAGHKPIGVGAGS